MSDIYLFRVWCNTENIWVEKWSEDVPATCPNNNTHEIDTTKTIIINSKLDSGPIDSHNKPWIHQSSRPIGSYTYFTGAGDLIQFPIEYGTGPVFEFEYFLDSTSTIDYIYLDFNMVENITYLHEGYMTWDGAKRDWVSLAIVPTVTPIIPSSNTFFNLYNGYLIVPAAGDGLYDVPGINLIDGTAAIDCGLVYMPINESGDRESAFWNAEWDPILGIFKNISPAPLGNGEYNLFAVEVSLFRFVNRLSLVNTGFLMLQTSDFEQIGHGMRVRAKLETKQTPKHEWSFSSWFTLYRQKL